MSIKAKQWKASKLSSHCLQRYAAQEEIKHD